MFDFMRHAVSGYINLYTHYACDPYDLYCRVINPGIPETSIWNMDAHFQPFTDLNREMRDPVQFFMAVMLMHLILTAASRTYRDNVFMPQFDAIRTVADTAIDTTDRGLEAIYRGLDAIEGRLREVRMPRAPAMLTEEVAFFIRMALHHR